MIRLPMSAILFINAGNLRIIDLIYNNFKFADHYDQNLNQIIKNGYFFQEE